MGRSDLGEAGGHQMNKPRLLFVCQSLPYPTDAGHHLRSYNVLRLLARDFDVRSLFFFRRATRPTDRDVSRGLKEVQRFGLAHAMPIPQDGHPIRFLWDHVRSVLTGGVYTRYVYDSREFHRELRRVLAEHDPEIVHLDTLDLSICLPALNHLPTVVTHHNIESRLLARRARAEDSLPRRAVLSLQSKLMEKEERYWAPRVSLNIVVSQAERESLSQMVPGARVRVVPNGVDTTVFKPAQASSRAGVIFVGPHSWLPNRDAMDYFVEDILPRIRERVGDVPVTWVGRAPAGVRRVFEARSGVRMTGFVDAIDPWVQSAACYVVPLRIGGGTRLKILDAWALGSSIVSTSIGCEGLDARDGENLLIRDEPDAFAAAVVRLLEDGELRRHLRAAGRETVRERYDWDVIGREMLPHYHGLLGSRDRKAVTVS